MNNNINNNINNNMNNNMNNNLNNMNNNMSNNMNNNMNMAFSQQNFYKNNQNQFYSQNNINTFPMINNIQNNQLINMNNSFQNNNNFIQSNISNVTSITKFPYVPMIGLTNIGKTCYMNSVLQCLSNLSDLTDYFLNPEKDEIIKENNITMTKSKEQCLSVVYKELLEKLWKSTPKVAYSPTKFKKALAKLNNLFKYDEAGDSKDFVCYLIMQLHTELNNIDSTLNDSSQKIIQQDIQADPYNPNQVYEVFMNDFRLSNNSIITKYFYGTNQNMFQCQVCQMNNIQKGINTPLIKYNYENYFYLEFPLEEVRKFVMMQNNNNMGMGMNFQNNNEVNIYDCFNYYQKQNEMEGYCEKCLSDNAKIFSVTKIFTPPKILIVIFNRGHGLQFNVKINFEMELDLSKIISNSNQIYELQSVIKHLGDNTPEGHFIAYCRSPILKYKDCWFCYNDSTVVQTNKWSDIHDIGVTYILFYKLKN